MVPLERPSQENAYGAEPLFFLFDTTHVLFYFGGGVPFVGPCGQRI
jgi:hypothetical protein